MHRGTGAARDDGRGRAQIGRSPPRRRRTPEDENKFCIYCKVQLSSPRLFEEHKNSAVHKQKEILIAKALSDGLQYCYTCEKIFPSKLALDAHCLMTRHKPLYRVDELQELITKNDNTNNLTPVQHVPESRRAREEKERQDIVTKLNEVRGTDATNEKGIRPKPVDDRNDKASGNKNFFCDLCNVDCMNYSNFKIHSESWRHRSEADKKRDEEKQKFDEEAEHQFNAAEEQERKKVPSHLTGKAGYFCEVCSIASISESAYLDHLRNRKHFRHVAQMRRPYKCYFCDLEFNVAKDFTYHLESRTHMDKAFNKEKNKKREKEEEWVEKKTDRRDHRDKDRDLRKDDRVRNRPWHHEKDEAREHRSKEGKKDMRKAELKEPVSKHADARKVEIVDVDNSAETGIKDLREKLKAQKNIIITKPNSPEKMEDGKNDEGEPAPKRGNRAKLEEVEKEFDTKFEALMKQYEGDHAGLQEKLGREREEDINNYQKYEDDFKELKEEEDFIRGNIDKLDDDDPCKQDFIIDIIRVQRKMEEVRLQLEMKEVTIIKRENSYRKHFPENEEKEVANAEPKNSKYDYDYNRGSAEKEEVNAVQNVADIESPESNVAPITSTDLRIKLERERLLKRLGPELESVDASLRDKLLAVILEKDKENDSLKHTIESKPGDTRQVVKDDDSCIRELTKREKQLEIELANLKSGDKKKKKNVPKSLVPQYDDVDDKKKDIKKRLRKRSVSSSSSSRSSSSSSDSSYYKNKKKRKSSPSKSRLKSKRSRSADKIRRKRRSRSVSREREKRKRVGVKKVKDDEKKKRVDQSKGEKKRINPKSPDGGKKAAKLNKSHDNEEDDDSDVQVITPINKVQPISVIGSSSTAEPTKMSTSSIIQVSTVPCIQPISSSNLPPQRREQSSFWKNPVTTQPTPKDSPKEDIWDSAISGGHMEDTTGAATLKLFDPHSGAQLPEDILNILKSVAPIIQQSQHQAAYKQPASRLPVANKPSVSMNSSDSFNNLNSSAVSSHKKVSSTSPNDVKKDDINNTPRIRSILKKSNDHYPSQNEIREAPLTSDHPLPEIPGLDSSTNHSSLVPSHRLEHISRSVLKSKSETLGLRSDETSKPSYNDDTIYGTTNENGRSNPINDHPSLKEDYSNKQISLKDPLMKPYEQSSQYDKRNVDVTDQNNLNYEEGRDYRRPIVSPSNEECDMYSNVDTYRQPLPERNVSDCVRSPHMERRSPMVAHVGRPAEAGGTYDAERNWPDRDPYLRSEITHRVIDYSYIRDTRVIPGDSHPPPARYTEETLKQPVRYPGETDDEYYARFERFYEINRRSEEQRAERERDLKSRRIVDGGRLNPDAGRLPPRDDYYTSTDRYDDLLPRTPPAESFRPRGVADIDRVPSVSGRVIDESVRRVERIPYNDDRRESGTHSSYQKVVEITKRVEDKSVRENTAERSYHLPESESRYTSDAGRNVRNDFLRDNPRDIDSRCTRGTLPRLPPPHLAASRISGGSHTLLSRPTTVTGDYDKYHDY